MTLHNILIALTRTLRQGNHMSSISQGGLYDTAKIGFVSDADCKWTIVISSHQVEIDEGIQNAQVILQGATQHFEALFSSEGDVTPKLEQLHITPHDEIVVVARLLKALNLDCDSAAYLANRPFALPLQYPVGENLFLSQAYQLAPLPTYDRHNLPQLIVDDHPEWVAMADFAWQRAFKNFRRPEPESGFVANYIDTAFNDNTFLWDSCFMTMFGRYCRASFNMMGTLDNFYAKQHADGFICREINTYTGHDLFTPHDPRSTGPNIFAWTEWVDYQFTGDEARLHKIFPALIAYHRWWQLWRSYANGGIWTSGLGSGMDNQPRVGDSQWHHRHAIWVDATMQQALSAKTLLQMAQIINRHDFDDDLQAEYQQLKRVINESLWNEESAFYQDLLPDGQHSPIKSIGAYWGVLAKVIPDERLAQMVDHLRDTRQFNRPHRVPSQSSDSPHYESSGWYWRGGVWSPTNYMVLRGLTKLGRDNLAHEIALNHVTNVAAVFGQTETLWENYAPEMTAKGKPAKADFVGWTGVSAINVPIEYLIGLRWITPGEHLLWDIRLGGRHGVRTFPIKDGCVADLVYDGDEKVIVTTSCDFQLTIRKDGRAYRHDLRAGEYHLRL